MEPLEETDQIQEEPRTLVLRAALKLFAEKGFFNTSLPEIAKLAGLNSAAGINQHFKTKQAIAKQLYDDVLESLSISIDDIKRQNAKPGEQLKGVVDLLFMLTDDAPEIMKLLLLINRQEILPEEKPLLETPAFAKIRKIFVEGVKSGEMRNTEPMLLHTYFFGMINQLLVQALSGGLNRNLDVYRAQVWQFAWNAIAKK